MQTRKFHLHFGAGKLGIGAVLPVINPGLTTIVIQKYREQTDAGEFDSVNWDELAGQQHALLRNSNGIWSEGQPKAVNAKPDIPAYQRSFRCQRYHWAEGEVTEDQLELETPNPPLVVVDHFYQVAPLLMLASSISCSLGPGQKDFADLLARASLNTGVPVLAFENTIARELHQLPGVVHTITDRICSGREMRESNRCVWVKCEEYIEIIAADNTKEVFNPSLLANRRVRLVPKSHLYFHARKKRALVNSLHQLHAIFCFRALSEQDLPTGGQYLPLVKAWFAKEHPDSNHSVELYIRLRALQLVWPLIEACESTKDLADAIEHFYGTSKPQPVYDALLQDAESVIERFSRAPDALSRLIDPTKLRKELKNYREHVLEPINFMWSNEQSIKQYPLYQKPGFSDLKGLEDVLTESFLIAMEKAMSVSEKHKSPMYNPRYLR